MPKQVDGGELISARGQVLDSAPEQVGDEILRILDEFLLGDPQDKRRQ